MKAQDNRFIDALLFSSSKARAKGVEALSILGVKIKTDNNRAQEPQDRFVALTEVIEYQQSNRNGLDFYRAGDNSGLCVSLGYSTVEAIYCFNKPVSKGTSSFF
jgi:hypothetical protein